MRSERIAEWILSLFEPKDHAVSTVGDLIEDAGERGRLWFWLQVTRVGLTLLWGNLVTAPLRMIWFAIFGWFVYLAANLILWFGGFILVTLLWGMVYFFTHHTGLEILSNMFRLRFDWPPPPSSVLHGTKLIVIWIVAPFQMGRFTALCWSRRAIAAWVIMSLLWPLLAVLIPFVAMSTRVTLPMLPLVQALVLLGILWQCDVSRRTIELKPN